MTMTMTMLEHFARRMWGEKASAEQRPSGGWTIRLPVPVFVSIFLTDREVVMGRQDYAVFLSRLICRASDRLAAAVRQYEAGARVEILEKRIEALENERSE